MALISIKKNCKDETDKRLLLSYITKQVLRDEEVLKHSAWFDDEDSGKPQLKRLRKASIGRGGLKCKAKVLSRVDFSPSQTR